MAAEAKRNARIELTAGTAGMDRGLADAKRKMRTFEREETRAAKAMAADTERAQKKSQALWANRGGRGVSMLGAGVSMALGGDIVSQLSDAVHGVADFERELTRFQVDAQLSGQKVGEFRDQVMAASEATGQSRAAILQGAHAYQILTGDADSAAKSAALFAEVANASGASMDDIAASAASMHNNLGLNADDFRKGFDVLLSMGHKSTVELRQFGAEMNRLTPLIKDFGSGSNMDKLAEMAASLETAAPAFKGSRDEQAAAAEGMQQLLLTMRKPRTEEAFSQLGVKIWTIDPKTKEHVLRDWLDILGDIKRKVPDKFVLQAAVGGKGQAFMALEEMIDNYQKLVDLKNGALGSDQVAKDNATYMASTTGRLELAWTHIKNAIAEALTPDRIDAFANAVLSAASALSTAANAFSWMMNGGSKEQRTNIAADDLAQTALDGTPEGDQTARKAASDILEIDPKNFAASYQTIRLRELNAGNRDPRFWNNFRMNDEGELAARQDAARKFLASEGMDAWAPKYDRTTTASRVAQQKAATPEQTRAAAKEQGAAIGAAIVSALSQLLPRIVQPHIKIGSETVQKAADNSVEHRRGRGR